MFYKYKMSLTYHSTKQFNKYFYGSDNYNSEGIYHTRVPNFVSIVLEEVDVTSKLSFVPDTTHIPKPSPDTKK